MQHAVHVENLVKKFGSINAVDGLSFDVGRGEIFGILGPNGAGKTTTLDIIEGLQPPTEGSIQVLGRDIRTNASDIKARIGVQLQSSAYYDYLDLTETLSLLGSFYPKCVAPDSLLEQVGLLDRSKSRVRELSGGQKQRFAVAASLVNEPELVILDEPTTGLDPQSRRNLWALVRDIHRRDVTVMLTTHYMDEAEAVCNRLAIMDHGRLLAMDSPRNLIAQVEATYTVKLVMAKPLSDAQCASLKGDMKLVQTGEDNTYLLRLKNEPHALQLVLDEISNADLGLEHLDITPVTLEDVFLELTGAELRD